MHKKTLLLLLALAAIGLLAVGCASIIHGNKQVVEFQTTPTGAWIEVKDTFGMTQGSCETPCSIKLKRNREYKAIITKSGYAPVEMVIQKGTDGWIWGNIVFGGVPGLVIDFISGAAYKLSPAEVQVTLAQSSSGLIPPDNDEEMVLIFDYDNLTPEEKASLAAKNVEKIPLR